VTNKLDRDPIWPWDPPAVRQVLQDSGWWRRPFWLTETGMQSDRYGEDGQARFYSGLLADWYRRGRTYSWMDRIFFYRIHEDPRYPDYSFGVLEAPPGLARKEAFYAYKSFIRSSAVDDCEVVGHTLPRFSRPAEVHDVVVTLRNTGSTPWKQLQHTLGVEIEPPGWTVSGGGLVEVQRVEPRETLSLRLTLTAPDDPLRTPPTPYTFYLRMERTGFWPFGDPVMTETVVSLTSPATFVEHPDDALVTAGETAIFKVAAISPEPTDYQWYRNSIELDDGNRFAGTTSPELLVLDADRHTAGDYYCTATTSVGTVYSSTARLIVVGRGGPGHEPRRPDGRQGASSELWEAWLRFRTQGLHSRQ